MRTIAAELIRLADGVKTIDQLAKEIGCSLSSAYQVRHRLLTYHGVTLDIPRKRQESWRGHYPSAARNDHIVQLINDGLSPTKVAARYGISRARVSQIYFARTGMSWSVARYKGIARYEG